MMAIVVAITVIIVVVVVVFYRSIWIRFVRMMVMTVAVLTDYQHSSLEAAATSPLIHESITNASCCCMLRNE